ncbi:MAG: hypothetical protein ACO1O1_01585 [Adhaeribacter sp.]
MQLEILAAKEAGRFGSLGGSMFGNRQHHISSFHSPPRIREKRSAAGGILGSNKTLILLKLIFLAGISTQSRGPVHFSQHFSYVIRKKRSYFSSNKWKYFFASRTKAKS